MRVGFVGGAIGLLMMAVTIIGNGGDVSVFIAAGEQWPERAYIAEQYGSQPNLRPGGGHDGQAFFLQALDPLYVSLDHVEHFDKPVYRARRVFYPVLAGLGGLAPPTLIPWLMGFLSALSFGLGAGAMSSLLVRRGVNKWWGLGFILNFGLLMEVIIGGAGVLALALGVAAVDLVERRRFRSAALLLVLSVLTREVMLLLPLGIAAAQLRAAFRNSGSIRSGITSGIRVVHWELLAIPTASLVVSEILIRIRFSPLGLSEAANGDSLDLVPFRGVLGAAQNWTSSPSNLAMIVVTIAILLWLLVRAWLTDDLLIWSTLGFCALAPLLTTLVWTEASDVSRAVAPIYSAAIVGILSFSSDTVSSNNQGFTPDTPMPKT